MKTSLQAQAEIAAAMLSQAWPRLRDAAGAELAGLGHPPAEIILCGCGDSHHAAASLAHALRIVGRVPARGVPAMHAARYLLPDLARDPAELLLIGISASGETARTLEAIELGSERGIRTLAISCNAAGPLAMTADHALLTELPDHPPGPGLLSYLAALLAGTAFAAAMAPAPVRSALDRAISELAGLLDSERPQRWEAGALAAEQIGERLPVGFLGSGPAYGAAMFAAAKLLETSGWTAWAQEAEEWAHLEYFADPPEQPLWLLSSGGRSHGREQELRAAAGRIGRKLFVSRWRGAEGWPGWLRELLGPLGLWVSPVAFADSLMQRAGETPFRGFAGGRSAEEGGGANRVKSSERIRSLKEFQEFQPGN